MERGMRKCVPTVVYHNDITTNRDYQIYSITVNYKGRLYYLLRYEKMDKIEPYKYKTFSSMYQSVLNILKNNLFYPGYYKDFNLRWYDIQWINMHDYVVEQYGLYMGKDVD